MASPPETQLTVPVNLEGQLSTLVLDEPTAQAVREAVSSFFHLPMSSFELWTENGDQLDSAAVDNSIEMRTPIVVTGLQERGQSYTGSQDGDIRGILEQLRADFRDDLSDLQNELRNERAARQMLENSLVQEVEARVQDALERQGGSGAGRGSEAQPPSVASGDSQRQAAAIQELQRAMSDMRSNWSAERDSRDRVDMEWRQALNEAQDRWDDSIRALRDSDSSLQSHVSSLQEAVLQEQVDRSNSVAKVKTQVSELVSLCERLQADTAAAASEARATASQMRSFVPAAATAAPAPTDAPVDISGLEEERRARRGAMEKLAQQLTIIIQSIQEEQQLRLTGDQDVLNAVDALSRRVDDQGSFRDAVVQSVEKVEQRLTARSGDAVRIQAAELDKLRKELAEEASARQQGNEALKGGLGRLETMIFESAEIKQKQDREVSDAISQTWDKIAEERRARIDLEARVEGSAAYSAATDSQKPTVGAVNEAIYGTVAELQVQLERTRDDVTQLQRKKSADVEGLGAQLNLVQSSVAAMHRAIEAVSGEQAAAADTATLAAKSQARAEAAAMRGVLEEIRGDTKQLRVALEKEIQMRDTGDAACLASLEEVRNSVSEVSAAIAAVQDFCQQELRRTDEALAEERNARTEALQRVDADAVHEDVQQMLEDSREEQAQVLDALREALEAEAKARIEGDRRLRTDTTAALQKEVTARLQAQSRVRDELAAQSKHATQESRNFVEALEDLRHGLETHTHELIGHDGMQANGEYEGAPSDISGDPNNIQPAFLPTVAA